MAAASDHMLHKIFGDNQRGREVVRGELPRVMSQEGSRGRFAGSCQRGRSRTPSRATPLGSGTGDSLTLSGFDFGWGGDAVLNQKHLKRSDHRFQASDLGPEGVKLGISIRRGDSIGMFGATMRHHYRTARTGEEREARAREASS